MKRGWFKIRNGEVPTNYVLGIYKKNVLEVCRLFVSLHYPLLFIAHTTTRPCPSHAVPYPVTPRPDNYPRHEWPLALSRLRRRSNTVICVVPGTFQPGKNLFTELPPHGSFQSLFDNGRWRNPTFYSHERLLRMGRAVRSGCLLTLGLIWIMVLRSFHWWLVLWVMSLGYAKVPNS